ncbi:MAG: carboxymuconolactone decarboxylase family protein [Bdellovibrionaceae bacterium]|nr:carboxymuconolactone decarboxylase family protein [Pseudobdellovibrionaceae bacterium]
MNIAEMVDQYLESEYFEATSSIYRDLSLNFKKLLEEGQLDPNERFLNLLAIAVSLANHPMANLAKVALKELGTPDDQIREAAETAGLMGMNNVYYKFRSYLSTEAKEHYTRAGLRMQSMMKPANGKQNFEMMSLAVSAVNGCPTCIASHENAIRELGVATEKIHDVARLAAVAKGLTSLKHAREFLA